MAGSSAAGRAAVEAERVSHCRNLPEPWGVSNPRGVSGVDDPADFRCVNDPAGLSGVNDPAVFRCVNDPAVLRGVNDTAVLSGVATFEGVAPFDGDSGEGCSDEYAAALPAEVPVPNEGEATEEDKAAGEEEESAGNEASAAMRLARRVCRRSLRNEVIASTRAGRAPSTSPCVPPQKQPSNLILEYELVTSIERMINQW